MKHKIIMIGGVLYAGLFLGANSVSAQKPWEIRGEIWEATARSGKRSAKPGERSAMPTHPGKCARKCGKQAGKFAAKNENNAAKFAAKCESLGVGSFCVDGRLISRVILRYDARTPGWSGGGARLRPELI